MSGVEGAVLGLPGLFLTGLRYFELIQFGCQFKKDFGASSLRLEAAHLHMTRWGEALGINVEPLDPTVLSQLSAYKPEEIKLAAALLSQIQDAFESAKRKSESFKGIVTLEDNADDVAVLDTNAEFEHVEYRFKKLSLTTRGFVKGYQKAKSVKDKTKERASWALYERSQFNQLVENVSAFIRELETLFAASQDSQKALCKSEVSKLDSEDLPLLLEVVGDDDVPLKEAIGTEAKARDLTFDHITVKGYARARFGHEYAPGERATGGGSHVYKNMKFGGNSVSHAGNAYGGPSIFQLPNTETNPEPG
ncbi:hypothetical protein B0A49_05694 [Cryomyces minteri]|uniref:Prion-inhibition and propagation HeLo domain-containing protein n=1 Tax=Cryomyces minteri TaxID=331657 RepID=A0A4U0X2G6_9PEZI|nr:hypothetical protein B0A49_05694 [Cryomyces minteri]